MKIVTVTVNIRLTEPAAKLLSEIWAGDLSVETKAANIGRILVEPTSDVEVYTRKTISADYEALGMTAGANAAVVKYLKIDTIEQLCQKTELELLGITGFGYTNLLAVNRALGDMGLHLRDHAVAPRNQIEELEFRTDTAYKLLKRAGVHSLTELLALDVVDLHRILGTSLDTVMDAMAAYEHASMEPAPLSPDRTVGDLLALDSMRAFSGFYALEVAGLDPTTSVRVVSESKLRASLAQVRGMTDRYIDDLVEDVRATLARAGYGMPAGPR